MRAVESINDLSLPDRAAAIILMLGDKAVTIFEKFEEFEIRSLSQRMAQLGPIQPAVIEELCINFADQMSSTVEVKGSIEMTERLLTSVLPIEKVSEILKDVKGPMGRTMWEKLSHVDPGLLASYLKKEYPQTVAVILSMIRASQASKIIALFPQELAWEVIQRMMKIDVVQKEVLDDLERTLKSEFLNTLRLTDWNPAQTVAEIFNAFDRKTELTYMERFEEENPQEAETIKSLMFVFDDILKLDDQSIQTVIRTIDKIQLAMSLKGASNKVKECFFRNISERAGRLLKDDMDAFGMVKMKEVDEAQSHVILHIKNLMSKGEVNIAEDTDGEDDELIG